MKLLKKVRRDARNKWNSNVLSLTTTLRWSGEEVTGISYNTDAEVYFKGVLGEMKDKVIRIFTHNFWRIEKANYARKYSRYLKARKEKEQSK